MSMVSLFKLVLDQNDAVVLRIASKNVGGETFDRDLGPSELQGDTDGFRNMVDVLGEPWGECMRLMRPSLT